MSIIEIKNITKKFGEVTAVNDVTLSINKNELFGFIGPDGAGKTTLFRLLTTLLIPNDGYATVLGFDTVKDYRQIRTRVGYMPGRFSLYQDLTVEENLNFYAAIFGTTLKDNYNLIKEIYVQIEPFKTRRAGNLSGGMKQKLALCSALIHKPELIFLDEPTTGVDPVSRNEFWDMLKNLQAQGITIIVSTPYMDEASLCDRVALMQKGKIMDTETPEDIIESFHKVIYGLKAKNMYEVLKTFENYRYKHSLYAFGEYFHYTDKRGEIDENILKNYAEENNIKDFAVERIRPGIEDCFLDLMEKVDAG